MVDWGEKVFWRFGRETLMDSYCLIHSTVKCEEKEHFLNKKTNVYFLISSFFQPSTIKPHILGINISIASSWA